MNVEGGRGAGGAVIRVRNERIGCAGTPKVLTIKEGVSAVIASLALGFTVAYLMSGGSER